MSSNTGTVGNMEGVDIGVLVGYFVIVLAFGLGSSLRNRGSVGGYFLAGRSMHFILVGASLYASNIGSGHFIGLAGSGASTGIGIAVFELNAIFVLQILGWVFVPVYIASGVFTMPEYLRKRFGGQRIRVYLAVLALLLSIFTKVAADLFAGALFLTQAFNWNIYLSIIILLLIAALFSISGGLTAVIWTDFIQTIIMLIGAFYLMIVCFIKVGGFEVVTTRFLHAIPNTTIAYRMLQQNKSLWDCGIPPDNSLHFVRSADDPNIPWPGVFFGLTISSVWYWCTDQVIVQRTLAAKNYSHAKGGCITAGYLKFTPMWLIVLPGMIARVLYPDEIGCADPATCKSVCGTSAGCTNVAYPLLVIRLMPPGARGLMMAVMMSALMSSLTSVFNSSSTIFTVDIWMRLRPRAGGVEVMIVSRVFVLVMAGIGIAWIPIVQNFSELFNYIQSVTSFLAPPICAVYLLAVLWRRTNELAAFWGLMVGLAIGVTRFAWESAYAAVPCGSPDTRPAVIKNVHYLHFGMLLFGIVVIVVVVISIVTKPIDEKHLVRLLFWNRHSKEKRVDLDEAETANIEIADGFVTHEDSNAISTGGDDIHHEHGKTTKSSSATAAVAGGSRDGCDAGGVTNMGLSLTEDDGYVTLGALRPSQKEEEDGEGGTWNKDFTGASNKSLTSKHSNIGYTQYEQDIGDGARASSVESSSEGNLASTSKKKQNLKRLPCWRLVVNWICGIEEHPELELTSEQRAAIAEKQTSLAERPLYYYLCNIMSLMLMSLTAFFWGFFA